MTAAEIAAFEADRERLLSDKQLQLQQVASNASYLENVDSPAVESPGLSLLPVMIVSSTGGSEIVTTNLQNYPPIPKK